MLLCRSRGGAALLLAARVMSGLARIWASRGNIGVRVPRCDREGTRDFAGLLPVE